MCEKDEHANEYHVRAADQIRQFLIDQGIKAGTKLPSEAQLVKKIGFSRTPVREAIRILANEGFIEVRRGSGIYAGKPRLCPSVDQLRWYTCTEPLAYEQLVDMRLILEVGVAPLVIERARPENLSLMAKAIWEARQLFAKGLFDLREYDYEFHRAYLSASGNYVAEAFGTTLHSYFKTDPHNETQKRTETHIRTVRMNISLFMKAYWQVTFRS